MSNVKMKLEGKDKTLKGISKSANGYRADVYYKGRKIYLGTYDSKLDAAISYDDFILDNKIDKKTNFTKISR